MVRLSIWVTIVMMVLSGPLQAAENMTFHGTLLEPPPCKINDNKVIDVSFGDIGLKKVDGVQYMKTIAYSIVCDSSPIKWDFGLTVTGSATAFDDAAVATNQANLGIRILQEGKAWPLNKRLDIDPKKQPVLQVVPVAKSGSVLKEGEFKAAATLRADYQ